MNKQLTLLFFFISWILIPVFAQQDAQSARLKKLDAFLDAPATDWSADMLKSRAAGAAKDTRIQDRQANRVMGTKPALTPDACVGTYFSDIYGNITVSQQGGAMQLAFEHSPGLSATLGHWHYDVWKINWNEPQAWFGFGTLKFDTDNNLTVTGLSFDVPNNDIFFEELKPRRVSGKE